MSEQVQSSRSPVLRVRVQPTMLEAVDRLASDLALSRSGAARLLLSTALGRIDAVTRHGTWPPPLAERSNVA